MEKIQAAGAGFRSLTEAIDTTSPAGRTMMQIVASFAEFEREMLRERTKSGMQAARDQGHHTGRPAKLTAAQKQEIIRLVSAGQYSPAQAARLFKVHRATVSRLLTQNQIKSP